MIQNNPFFNKLNNLGKKGQAFLFIIDFEGKQPEVFPLNDLPPDIHFQTPGLSNHHFYKNSIEKLVFIKQPISFENYKRKFDTVLSHI